MEHLATLFGPLFERMAGEIVVRILKPSNIKARLSTVEAYCVYYPVYVVIQRLGKSYPELVEWFVESLHEDPSLLVAVLPGIGERGPSRVDLDAQTTQIKERFRRDSSLLYLPEPFFKELAQEVRDDTAKILDLVKRGNLESALKDVEERFKKKYVEGDVQIPGVEGVIEEAIVFVISLLKLRRPVNSSIAKSAMYYYSVLTLERALESIPLAITTILTAFVPTGEPPSAASELMKRLQPLSSSPYMTQELQRKSEELGFTYEEFKKAFLEAESLFR